LKTSERLIVGLGNPGSDYEDTRHNVGFEVVRRLAMRRRLDPARLECRALVAEAKGLLLAMPQTFMNRSGYSVRCLVEARQLDSRRVLVVYDDVDLPLGRLRLRPEGGPGGHRGMESIVENLRSERVPRLRLGIAPVGGDTATLDLVEFVLTPFADDELEVVQEMIDRAVDACDCWLREGNEATMNRFNG
jgi:PTH1 family peptidyl-tRNA hydrolase